MKISFIDNKILSVNNPLKQKSKINSNPLAFGEDKFQKSNTQIAKNIFKENIKAPITNIDALDMVNKYCKNKDGKIDIERAKTLSSLFNETGCILPEETDILFSCVYNEKQDEISYSKYMCSRYLIFSMYDLSESQIPVFILEKFASLYRGMILKNTKALIDSHLIEGDADIYETKKAYRDWLDYSKNYKEKLNDNILLKIKKGENTQKVPLSALSASFSPDICAVYDNDIYRMHCLLTQFAFKDYNQM